MDMPKKPGINILLDGHVGHVPKEISGYVYFFTK